MPSYNQFKEHDKTMNELGLLWNGTQIIENRDVEENAALFKKESNTLYVGNMYPFLFMGCGQIYTFEQCVEFSCAYAMGYIETAINEKIQREL